MTFADPLASPPQTPDARRLQRMAWVALGLLALSLALATFPVDDGLRHVGLAFESPRSWGEVYPHSIFERHAAYDPWMGYDRLLRGGAWLLQQLPLSRLAAQFLLTKCLVFGFTIALLALAAWRAGIFIEVRRGQDLALCFAVLALLLGSPLLRATSIRPFAFGTLYLIFATRGDGLLHGAMAAASLSLLYPYLAWIYTLPVAAAHLLRGHRGFGLGTALAALAALALQPGAFWGLLLELLRSDGTRALLDAQITEFAPLWQHLGLPLAVLAGFALLWPHLGAEARRLRAEHLLLLAFLVPSVKYVRYFLDVVLALLFVSYGRETVRVLASPFGTLLERWREIFARRRSTAAQAPPAAPAAPRGSPLLRVFLAVAYLALFGLAGWMSTARHRELTRLSATLEPVPRGAVVLTEFNMQYAMLYARPDLRLIPSCEIGFPAPEIREAYLGFFNKGAVCPLARQIAARYLVESGGMYIDPRSARCLELRREEGRLRIWRVH